MRVRYSFSSRRTRKIKNINKQRGKYPALVKKIIDKSDIILEVLDARFAIEMKDPELEKMIQDQNKKMIRVLNKSDLADIKKIKRFELRKISPYVFTSCSKREGIKNLRDRIKIETKKVKEPVDKMQGRITVGVIGYPNTGKSSLINLLIGRSSAGTGSDAGYTKGIQKLRLTPEIVLLDSPGVIPKQEYSSEEGKAMSKHTKFSARSHSQVKNPEQVIADLMQEFPKVLEKFYKIPAKGNPEALIEKLGRKKGFLKKGDEVNEDKTSRSILKDWQEGKIKI